ncbi:unnamed protein product [Nesidiocoris tenuis]|uniref:Uncharacterized protein n=1 Tax=Nesidiocoris tenuis TaxID=355587 RepID=A0A6H5GNP0_9HEMI|nr:unnamed protein product [Nesidiocoris tenuis]
MAAMRPLHDFPFNILRSFLKPWAEVQFELNNCSLMERCIPAAHPPKILRYLHPLGNPFLQRQKLYELMCCDGKKLNDLLSNQFVYSVITESALCSSFGIDLLPGQENSSISNRAISVSYLRAFLGDNTLAALCNYLAISWKKIALNVSEQEKAKADESSHEESSVDKKDAAEELPTLKPTERAPTGLSEPEPLPPPPVESAQTPVTGPDDSTNVDQFALDSLFPELEEETMPTSSETAAKATAINNPPIQQKESVFVRLANRIKVGKFPCQTFILDLFRVCLTRPVLDSLEPVTTDAIQIQEVTTPGLACSNRPCSIAGPTATPRIVILVTFQESQNPGCQGWKFF